MNEVETDSSINDSSSEEGATDVSSNDLDDHTDDDDAADLEENPFKKKSSVMLNSYVAI